MSIYFSSVCKVVAGRAKIITPNSERVLINFWDYIPKLVPDETPDEGGSSGDDDSEVKCPKEEVSEGGSPEVSSSFREKFYLCGDWPADPARLRKR